MEGSDLLILTSKTGTTCYTVHTPDTHRYNFRVLQNSPNSEVSGDDWDSEGKLPYTVTLT